MVNNEFIIRRAVSKVREQMPEAITSIPEKDHIRFVKEQIEEGKMSIDDVVKFLRPAD